jgi:hypothetical protein
MDVTSLTITGKKLFSLPIRETFGILSIGENYTIEANWLTPEEIYLWETWRVYPFQIDILNI